MSYVEVFFVKEVFIFHPYFFVRRQLNERFPVGFLNVVLYVRVRKSKFSAKIVSGLPSKYNPDPMLLNIDLALKQLNQFALDNSTIWLDKK